MVKKVVKDWLLSFLLMMDALSRSSCLGVGPRVVTVWELREVGIDEEEEEKESGRGRTGAGIYIHCDRLFKV